MTATSLWELAERARKRLSEIAKGNRDRALLAMADLLRARWEEVLRANREDLEEAERTGLPKAKLDRLALKEKDLKTLTEGLRQIARLPDPLGRIEGLAKRPNGLRVGRMRVPLGLIGFIYEARPGATVEAVSVALKAGNAMLLRGARRPSAPTGPWWPSGTRPWERRAFPRRRSPSSPPPTGRPSWRCADWSS